MIRTFSDIRRPLSALMLAAEAARRIAGLPGEEPAEVGGVVIAGERGYSLDRQFRASQE